MKTFVCVCSDVVQRYAKLIEVRTLKTLITSTLKENNVHRLRGLLFNTFGLGSFASVTVSNVRQRFIRYCSFTGACKLFVADMRCLPTTKWNGNFYFFCVQYHFKASIFLMFLILSHTKQMLPTANVADFSGSPLDEL